MVLGVVPDPETVAAELALFPLVGEPVSKAA